MVYLVKREFVIDAEGRAVRCGVYLAGENDPLPEDAPVGSRAVLDNGSVLLKTPAGWAGKGGNA